VLREPRLAYLVPSTGTVDVNGVRIHARDGAAIKDVDIVTITAIEDADVVMVDVPQLQEEPDMQGSATARTSTGFVAIHPLDPEDAAITAAMRSPRA
jgi:redox-sensitive bicupin YhaK (pirin superfamily)